MNKVFNVSCRKVGGITFIKVGRLNVSFSVSRSYRDFAPRVPRWYEGGSTVELDGSELMVVERDR